jgi:hypothetical protein
MRGNGYFTLRKKEIRCSKSEINIEQEKTEKTEFFGTHLCSLRCLLFSSLVPSTLLYSGSALSKYIATIASPGLPNMPNQRS